MHGGEGEPRGCFDGPGLHCKNGVAGVGGLMSGPDRPSALPAARGAASPAPESGSTQAAAAAASPGRAD